MEDLNTNLLIIILHVNGSILLKGSVYHKRHILNIHASNNRAAKYMKQKLMKLKGEIDTPTVMGESSNIPFMIIDRKIRKSVRICKTHQAIESN